MTLIENCDCVKKTYWYEGGVNVKLDENCFNFNISQNENFPGVYGVLYDISSKVLNGDKLSIKVIKRGENTSLRLDKIDSTNKQEEIVLINMEKSDFHISIDSELSENEEDSDSTAKMLLHLSDQNTMIFVQNSKTGDLYGQEHRQKERMHVESEFLDQERQLDEQKEIKIQVDNEVNDQVSLNLIKEQQFEDINRIFGINGQCSLVTYVEFVDVTFEIDDNVYCEYSFLTNPETNIYCALNQIFFDGIYSTFGLYMKCSLLDPSMTFSQCDTSRPITIDVSPRCLAARLHEPETLVEIPWNNNTVILARRLASVLGIDCGGIRFYNLEKVLIDESSDLDLNEFEIKDSDLYQIFYEIHDGRVKCTHMIEGESSFEFTIPPNCTVSDLKRRFQSKFEKECSRFVVCRKNKRLGNEDIIEENEEIQYLVTELLENVTSKELIGEGGFGKIYKCTFGWPNETKVLKKFTALLHEEREWKSFVRELRTMQHLSMFAQHPNILKYFDLYIDDDDICIAMEYVPRGSLRTYLNEVGSLEEREIRFFSIGILRGVQYLHDNKVNHRDVKADNVLLGENDTIKLCDFGLASILSDYSFSELSRGVVQTGACGSFRWMAPEVILGEKYGNKADIWSIGVTVVEMVTGHVPYHEIPNLSAAIRITTDKRIDFVSTNPLSPQLLHFINSCLTADANKRPNIATLLDCDFFKD